MRNVKKEDLNSIVQDENVKKIGNNALNFVQDFANKPENKESISNILNSFGGLDQLTGGSLNLNNILDGLNNIQNPSNGGPNIINQFLSGLTANSSSNDSMSLSQLG